MGWRGRPDEDPDDAPESEGDWEDPEPPDDDDDEEPCITCPYCQREIPEESERCAYCGHYLSREDAPPARKPLWLVIGVVACLYVVYRWIVPR
ncbi:MAG: zinc ribbon domain-containing protein [Isosphaeraceae bacterium]